MKRTLLKKSLEKLYSSFNVPGLIHPDPLEYVLGYQDVRDREIAALIASSFAYGRVKAILACIHFLLEKMGSSPGKFVRDSSEKCIRKVFRDFKYRFHTGDDVSDLLLGAGRMIRKYGSLGEGFASNLKTDDPDVRNALGAFSKEICSEFETGESTLFPSPEKGSACKRANLMLRWLVRKDAVDPGGWEDFVKKSQLLVPVDTHMHRLSCMIGLTDRNAADLKTVLEITHAFAGMFPEDPVRMDFALTRFGIRSDFAPVPPCFSCFCSKK